MALVCWLLGHRPAQALAISSLGYHVPVLRCSRCRRLMKEL